MVTSASNRTSVGGWRRKVPNTAVGVCGCAGKVVGKSAPAGEKAVSTCAMDTFVDNSTEGISSKVVAFRRVGFFLVRRPPVFFRAGVLLVFFVGCPRAPWVLVPRTQRFPSIKHNIPMSSPISVEAKRSSPQFDPLRQDGLTMKSCQVIKGAVDPHISHNMLHTPPPARYRSWSGADGSTNMNRAKLSSSNTRAGEDMNAAHNNVVFCDQPPWKQGCRQGVGRIRSGADSSGRRYCFECDSCGAKWNQTRPELIAAGQDPNVVVSNRATKHSDKRRSNGYNCGACGEKKNAFVASAMGLRACSCEKKATPQDTVAQPARMPSFGHPAKRRVTHTNPSLFPVHTNFFKQAAAANRRVKPRGISLSEWMKIVRCAAILAGQPTSS